MKKEQNLQTTERSAYDWKKEQKKHFCRNRECPFYNGWSYGCEQNSDAQRCAARMFY
jgi:hypothetical protein